MNSNCRLQGRTNPYVAQLPSAPVRCSGLSVAVALTRRFGFGRARRHQVATGRGGATDATWANVARPVADWFSIADGCARPPRGWLFQETSPSKSPLCRNYFRRSGPPVERVRLPLCDLTDSLRGRAKKGQESGQHGQPGNDLRLRNEGSCGAISRTKAQLRARCCGYAASADTDHWGSAWYPR